jgi:hypothetical protein
MNQSLFDPLSICFSLRLATGPFARSWAEMVDSYTFPVVRPIIKGLAPEALAPHRPPLLLYISSVHSAYFDGAARRLICRNRRPNNVY